MSAPGTRDPAASRRRNFALVAALGLGSVLVIAVAVGPQSPGRPAARGAVSPGASAPTPTPAAATPHTAAAKLAAEANGSASAGTDAATAQALQPLPSWNAPPKALSYHGYQFQVPGSWPVYDLTTHPAQCVLFDTHAVYLGAPGSAQDCPAHAYGRTEALLVQPSSQAPQASAITLPHGTAALPSGTALPADAAASHMFQVAVPAAGVLVTATFDASEPRLRAILAGATLGSHGATAGGGSPAPTATGSGSPAASAASLAATRPAAATQSVMTVSARQRASAASATPPARPLAAMVGSGLGFDTCTVPSIPTMTQWLASPYRVVGTYLGGMNWACSYGNFSTSWVRQAAAEGWRFMPLWVGRQAPCTPISGVAVIDSGHAVAEGRADAQGAVAAARAFGYGRGTPVYFDMEGYIASSGCSGTVLRFLAGWTQALHAAGYVSGVYSSAASGIRDLGAQYAGTRYPRPDDIWIANWNGEPVLTDPNLRNNEWANHQRLHQYAGPHTEKWGNGTLAIDADAADGLVVGMPAVPDLPRPTESARPSELAVAPGKTARVSLTLHGVPRTPVNVHWQVGVPRGMTATPGHGNVDLWPVASYSVTLALSPGKSMRPGRYDVPITVSSHGHPITKTFVLVSVVAPGHWLPTAYPIVLYAADRASAAVAAGIARSLAMPPGTVTGNFQQAWKDVLAGSKRLVLAVGQPAADALYFNDCGWTDPGGVPRGYTPFYYPGYPLRHPPGRNYFELADARSAAGTSAVTTQLTQYALAGTLPNYGSQAPVGTPPALSCLGGPNITVP